MSRLVMLCARTARSSAYLQALADAGITPDTIILYGENSRSPTTTRSLQVQALNGLFCPDLALDLQNWLSIQKWNVQECTAQHLGDEKLQALISEQAPELLVYSGYGGQIVPPDMVRRYSVLHVHSGWLPEYRGSTTLYYQVLDQQQCAASALLLDEQIDTGPVLMRKTYPMPPAGMDIDYLYDSLIRADLLVDVIRHWQNNPGQWHLQPQPHEHPAYYIIHPLLKHLALGMVDLQGEVTQ